MKLTENNFGTGSVWTPKDESVSILRDVAMDTMPFDWNIGFEVDELKTKNQGTSGSCGGQAGSYKMEASFGEEKSAKFLYAPIAYPGGGSTEPDISNRLMNVGICDESFCVSYKNNKPPTEAFMASKGDITAKAIDNATAKAGKRVYVQRNIDAIAQAVRDHKGIIIGIYGTNNGTWLSKFPKPPATLPDDTMWRHFLFVGKAKMIDGTKYIGVKNSWGDIGEDGWQYIDASYMAYIWTSFSYIETDIQTSFSHKFTTQLKIGNSGEEVVALQQALKVDGEFPSTQVCTGYFGTVTQKAVKNFQIKYAKDILIPAGVTSPTGIVGMYTLAKLNQLFNQ